MTIFGTFVCLSIGACIGVVLAGLLAAAKDDLA